MGQFQKLCVLVLLFQILLIGHAIQKRTIIFQGFSNCQEDEKNPIHFNGAVKSIVRNIYEVNGEIKADEIITGPLEVFSVRNKTLIF